MTPARFDMLLRRAFVGVPHPDMIPGQFIPLCAEASCPAEVWFFDQCMACAAWICPSHAVKHPCRALEKWEHQKMFFKTNGLLGFHQPLEAMRNAKLEQAAMELRPGTTATIRLPDLDAVDEFYKFLGAEHLHAIVEFNDGATWLARVLLTGNGLPPRQALPTFMAIEFATVKWLRTNCPDIPVPEAWMPLSRAKDLDYYFVEYVESDSLARQQQNLSGDENTDMIRQLADYFLRLAEHPFSGIGSLHPSAAEGGEPVLGPLIWTPQDLTMSAYPLGPFRTLQEAYLTIIDYMLLAIEAGALYEDPANLVATYLVFLDARQLVLDCEDMGLEQPTYLRHSDLHPGNILWDSKESKITAIIDWDRAYTAPMAQAFMSPETMCLPARLPNDNTLGGDELQLIAQLEGRGRHDIADCIRGGRKYARLMRLLRINDFAKWGTARSAWLLREAFLGDAAGPAYESLDDLVADAMTRHGENSVVKSLQLRAAERMTRVENVSKESN